MKNTAIVVTYNRLSLLKECIHGILSQTKKADNIIVINNQSTDGTGLHRNAIEEFGQCKYHRKSFKLKSIQADLF